MKHILFIALLFGIKLTAISQVLNPVKWTYSAKKIADKTYEIHVTASMDNGWHIYAQVQPKDAIAQPTKIVFSKNPLLSLSGKIKEVGTKEKFEDKTVGIAAFQYAGQVDFVQVVTMKFPIKTSINGNLTYQVCTNKQCLPAKTLPFSVAIQ